MDSSYTYCSGPKFSSKIPITSKTLVEFIKALEQFFGPGYAFEPEGITEGGIIMTKWPGKENHSDQQQSFSFSGGQYKTMRFNIEQARGKWPWVDDQTFKEWKESPEATVIWDSSDCQKHPVKGGTYLKAFYGAPCWTVEEVANITKAMNAVGWEYVKKTVPKKKELKSTSGTLGLPWDFK